MWAASYSMLASYCCIFWAAGMHFGPPCGVKREGASGALFAEWRALAWCANGSIFGSAWFFSIAFAAVADACHSMYSFCISLGTPHVESAGPFWAGVGQGLGSTTRSA